MLSKLTTQFFFASFAFPKHAWTLPRGSFKKRIEHMKNPVTGGYFHAPKPNANAGMSFYLDSDFMPGMRWQWADEVVKSIGHKGWYCEEDYQGDTIRGLVFRLPRSRGFLAGWSMGKSMASEVESGIYETEEAAARAADSLAEEVAEREREYQEEERARIEAEEAEQEAKERAHWAARDVITV